MPHYQKSNSRNNKEGVLDVAGVSQLCTSKRQDVKLQFIQQIKYLNCQGVLMVDASNVFNSLINTKLKINGESILCTTKRDPYVCHQCHPTDHKIEVRFIDPVLVCK